MIWARSAFGACRSQSKHALSGFLGYPTLDFQNTPCLTIFGRRVELTILIEMIRMSKLHRNIFTPFLYFLCRELKFKCSKIFKSKSELRVIRKGNETNIYLNLPIFMFASFALEGFFTIIKIIITTIKISSYAIGNVFNLSHKKSDLDKSLCLLKVTCLLFKIKSGQVFTK